MTSWDLLQLPKTRKISQIRNAYVDALCAIELDAFSVKEFLILRDAYCKALLYARTGDYEDYEVPDDTDRLRLSKGNIAYMEPILGIREMALPEAPKKGFPSEVVSQLDEIIHLYTSMMALHDDFYGRIVIENWKELMQTELMGNMKIIHFLRLPVLASCASDPLLPHNVWVYLDLLFHWSDTMFSIPKDYEKERKILAIETDPIWDMHFARFRLTKSLPNRPSKEDQIAAVPEWEYKRIKKPSMENTDFELYASYRRNMRDAIIEDNEEEAEKWFIMAANLFDGENWWGIDLCAGPSSDLDYQEEVLNYYKGLHDRNIAVDIIGTEDDISQYSLLIAPVLYMTKCGYDEKIREYVSAGGTFVATYFSGIVDENDLVITGGYPGKLRDILGIWVEEIDALPPGTENSFTCEGIQYPAKILCDIMHTEGAQIVSSYEKDFYSGTPVITKNSFGKGAAYYVGTSSDGAFYREFLKPICEGCGIKPVIETPEGVEATLRQKNEKSYLFLLNHSDEKKTLTIDRSCEDLLSGNKYSSGDPAEMKPKDVLILEC